MKHLTDTLVALFADVYDMAPDSIVALSGAGSNRQYFRLSSGLITGQIHSAIGVIGEDRKENHAFITLARHMRNHSLSIPQILTVSEDEMCYLLQDLGSVSLYDKIAACQKQGLWDDATVSLLHKVMVDLPNIQFETAKDYDFEHDVTRQSHFDQMGIFWDLNYFKYCFLKPCNIPFDEVALEDEFHQLSSLLLSIAAKQPSRSFLYRDFQSRNVMIHDNIPYYIDFQGGFEGPCYYDVASFLWQARAGYDHSLREQLLHTYHESLQKYIVEPYPLFVDHLQPFVFFRLIQVLGAYGFRGLFERKAMFLSPIRQALQLIQTLPADFISSYPTICQLINKINQLPQFSASTGVQRLRVRVTSFSYKKGLPDDPTGNGGGFVFDCRAPHNPGRYKEYKQLTGLDQPVIDFLEGRAHDYDNEKLGTELNMPEYLEHVYGVVDPAVETYLKRGFTSLMVSFGCTGGRHRSVYGAQHTAEHLHKKYPDAIIELWHREQGIHEIWD